MSRIEMAPPQIFPRERTVTVAPTAFALYVRYKIRADGVVCDVPPADAIGLVSGITRDDRSIGPIGYKISGIAGLHSFRQMCKLAPGVDAGGAAHGATTFYSAAHAWGVQAIFDEPVYCIRVTTLVYLRRDPRREPCWYPRGDWADASMREELEELLNTTMRWCAPHIVNI